MAAFTVEVRVRVRVTCICRLAAFTAEVAVYAIGSGNATQANCNDDDAPTNWPPDNLEDFDVFASWELHSAKDWFLYFLPTHKSSPTPSN